MISSLRPDEIAAETQIEKSRNFDSSIKKGVKGAVGLATGGAVLGAGARILPFLSELIPTDLAIKGINKVSPQVGKFLQKGMSQGLDIKDGLQFLKDNLGGQQEPAKETRNVIEQYSPELFQFLNGEIQKGQSPIAAATQAAKSGKFSKEITKMQNDHKTGFGAIVQSIFGGGNMAQKHQGKAALQQSQQPQQGQAQAGGNTDQALLAALEKILTM